MEAVKYDTKKTTHFEFDLNDPIVGGKRQTAPQPPLRTRSETNGRGKEGRYVPSTMGYCESAECVCWYSAETSLTHSKEVAEQ